MTAIRNPAAAEQAWFRSVGGSTDTARITAQDAKGNPTSFTVSQQRPSPVYTRTDGTPAFNELVAQEAGYLDTWAAGEELRHKEEQQWNPGTLAATNEVMIPFIESLGKLQNEQLAKSMKIIEDDRSKGDKRNDRGVGGGRNYRRSKEFSPFA